MAFPIKRGKTSQILFVMPSLGTVSFAATDSADGSPIPAKLTLYLSKGTEKGAIASFGVLAVLDETSRPYKEIGLLQSLGPLSFSTNVHFREIPVWSEGTR